MENQAEILWQPRPEDIDHSRLATYRKWLKHEHGFESADYESLWQWSVDDPERFWKSIADFFQVKFHTAPNSILSGQSMPDVHWFSGSTLNYAEHIFLGMAAQQEAIFFATELGPTKVISVEEMWKEVTRLQVYFKSKGVKAGDRIVGYMPNIPEATYAFLAAVSMGAVWSCCSQDFGVSSVIDRFAQIEPTIFIAADGYYYNGKTHGRLQEINEIRKGLPHLKDSLIVSFVAPEEVTESGEVTYFNQLAASNELVPTFEAVPFAHPLWVLYSSGTTGAPKAITHSHGGCLLEHLKYLAFHNDVHAGERFFWYSTTGWMMWNFLQGSMLLGASIVLYDGSPGFPNLNRLWKLAEDISINHFGTSAPFLVAGMKAGISPCVLYKLDALRSIGSTGSPLPPEAFDWVYKEIHPRIWLCSMSGGTDVCTAFVGGVIEKPIIKGEIQSRALGCALYAFNDALTPVVEEVGEMVIVKPMPSMPIYFWNDPEKKRYRSSYFEDIPGVWRHGDWVKITCNGGVVIYGRSDATLNRQGIRIGTAEIYRVLNDIAELEDGLIVNLELKGGRHYMPLFVKLAENHQLDDALIMKIALALKSKCSPRHVPDAVFQVDDIPYTISGKKMEAPVKKILMGITTGSTLSKDAMRNPSSLNYFENFQVPEELG